MGCEMRTLVSLVSLKVTMSDVDGTVPGEELSRPPLVCLESLVLGQRQNRPAPCLYILLRYSLKGPTKKALPCWCIRVAPSFQRPRQPGTYNTTQSKNKKRLCFSHL